MPLKHRAFGVPLLGYHSVNGSDLQRERQRYKLSLEDLAAQLDVPVRQMRTWEERGLRIPKRLARTLDWHLGAAAQEKALAASGLPACEWVTRWESTFDITSNTAQEQLAALDAHAATCDLCHRREVIAERAGPLPEYRPGLFTRVLDWVLLDVLGAFERLPPGRRLLVLFGVVATLLGAVRLLRNWPPQHALAVLVIITAVAAAMVAGPGLYAQTGPVRAHGAIGRWLARFVSWTAGLLSFFGVVLVSGYAVMLDLEVAATWRASFGISVAMGFLYATLAPYADYFRRY